MNPPTKEQIEKLAQAKESHNSTEADRISKELPEIAPLQEGETVATAIPKRKKKGN